MINMGLKAADRKKLDALLITHHRIRVEIYLMDLSHRHLGEMTDMLLGGQVSIDADGDQSTRSATVELLDPTHKLKLDGDSPEDGSIYYTRMIRIVYIVQNPERTESYRIPIFTGPLTKVDRNGPVIALEAHGKEKLAMSAVWKARTFKQGLKKTYVIRQVLTDLGTESPRYISIPDRPAKLPKKMSINRQHNAWDISKRIAASMNSQLFYNGYGVAMFRKRTTKTVYVFREKGALLTLPQANFDVENATNAVEVIGGKPKGAKKKIVYRLVAPRAHALSPWAIGRYGNPRYLPETIEDDAIRSAQEAKSVAYAHLRNRLIEQVTVSFDSLPIPYLEENDLCRVVSSQFTGTFRLKQMTIPLTANGVSSVGYLRRVTPNRRQIRIRNNQKKKRGRGNA